MTDASPSDPAHIAVQQRQQSVIQQLANVPLVPSPLETLAAAVKTNIHTPVETEQTHTDLLATGDSELATTVHRTMLELKTNPTLAASKTIQPIPPNSLFGQWWDYLGKALKGHGFIEWASQHNIDLASLRYDRTGHALIAKVNGVEQRYTATDFAQKYPAFFDVIEPVLTAAQEFAAHGQQISLAQVGNSNVPYQWVANFYGISDDPSGPTFEQQTSLPGRTQQFPRPSADPQKVVTWLNRKKTELGDSNDRYSLIDQLRNWNSDSGSRRFIVDPASSLQPKGVTTVAAFLSRKDWNPTVTKADNDNLLAAIQTPAPQSPPLGNRWGFLSTQLSLSTEQRVTVGEFVKTSIGAHDSLLSYLSANVTDLSTDPEQALDQLVSSDAALELAAKLESQMKGAPTATSRKQWLLTALVLEIDRTAGAQHKTVAGIDLMGAAYSGHSVESIREQFGRDLAAKKGIPANLAPAISRLMMSGMAPQLLVKEVPQNVTLGSPEWVNFTTAVNRIEWTAPGATQGMTYQQVMNYNNIKPISALEAQIQNYAQMNPLLDWAALNNNVNKDNYTLEQLKDSQVKFQAQTKKTAESISWLSKSDPPNRRAMTLEILRKEFGPDIDYESRYMIEDEGFGINSGRHYSLAEIYETGRLGENWLQEGKHVDFERLRKRANEPDLPVVNDQFDKAIKQDFHLRRRHTVTLFENMLRKLPVEEQKSLLYGDVEFLNVEGAGSGMVMTSVYNGVRRDFAVYPASGLIVRIADIDPSTPMGQKVSLEIDAEAFKNGTFPKPGVKSDVVLRVTDQHLLDDNDEPWPLEVTFPAHSANDRFSPNYARGRLSKLANVMVDSTYLNKTQFLNLHRNWSSNTLETATEPSDFFKAIWHALPGTSSLEDLYHGQFLKAGVDLAIDVAIYAAAAGAGELWTLAKSGASWAAAKIEAGFIERFGAKDAESIALRDMTNTSVSQSLASSSRMQGSHIAEQTAEMANGTVVRAGTQEQVKVTAVNRAGNWYAYDAEADAAYGPALEGFRSDTSIGLKTETLPDGTSKQIPDRLLPEDAQVINRSTYSDVKIGNKVYRYDPKEPDVLTDLESADHFNDTHGLEAFCPAGPRVKRQTDGVCFAKVVSDFSGNTAKMVQGLEHTRLYPSSGGAGLNSTLVYERRLFDVVEKDGVYKTVQRDLVAPVDYLPTTRGTIVKDPHFGLSGADTLPNLEQNSRIVKLDAISSLSKDQRELRGTIAQTTTTSGATQRYIVVEADSLTFYYSKFDAKSTELTFKRIGESASEFELELVSNHIQEMEGLLEMAGAPLRKDFVSLPSLDSAFSKLEAAGYTPAQVNELKATIAPFNAEKKREFVYQLINKLTSSSDELVLKSASLEPLDKTADFANLAAEKQNKFYAEGAKNSVNTQVKATGIGSSNKRIPNKPNDIYREEVAEALVGWIQDIKVKSPNYVNSVLKFGAGNCGEMAEAATQIIKKSGGSAETWYVHGGDHAFTVVGGPASAGKSTVNFAEAEWKDAWIVDPWADISCKASNYTALLEKKMTQWESSGLEIYINGDWRSPLYPKWRTELMTFEKRPLYAE
ncbi:hypothetical protein [Pseudomonas sp. GZJR-8]|uniref:hypothetical protein n=1 Tax=Pseudomonas sp. GZJR-8 TaxID=1395925 RepID=UPI000CDB07B6|nr:hypothetical protein [Pseudomonas sp. GZJR-8]